MITNLALIARKCLELLIREDSDNPIYKLPHFLNGSLKRMKTHRVKVNTWCI